MPRKFSTQADSVSHNLENSTQQALKALWTLSGFAGDVNVDQLSQLIGDAPDPETACRAITKFMHDDSEVLFKQWRKIISRTWLDFHPQASCAVDLPLTSKDVVQSPVLRDARALLEEINERPATLTREKAGWTIDCRELGRLVRALPSGHDMANTAIEHEWSFSNLRRVRHILQALRLIRVMKGKLIAVRSRRDRFMQLPLPQQFYLLWHADVYHVDWDQYAGQWRSYVSLMQNYLPLIWELGGEVDAGQIYSTHEMAHTLIDVFEPLWQQELNWPERNRPRSFAQVYERSALPIVVEKLLIDDIFARHGLIELHDSVDVLLSPFNYKVSKIEGNGRWTKIGQILMDAEQNRDLPCAHDILEEQ